MNPWRALEGILRGFPKGNPEELMNVSREDATKNTGEKCLKESMEEAREKSQKVISRNNYEKTSERIPKRIME